MKKIHYLVITLVSLTCFNCSNSRNTEETQDQENTSNYELVRDSTKVGFVAYKTTDKVPVGGEFTNINISNFGSGDTAFEAMNGTEFSIPVSSLFTNDPTGTRDPKILEFFFDALENTELISGVFKVDANQQCSIDVTLNGQTENIPLEYSVVDDTKFVFDGVMELANWDALDAVASINKACEALHTGSDGISKTWSEVAVHAEVLLAKK
ncbi:YceI-like domain-containing protein [Cyclobacterium lianum]|uniref:YceI-like domain-containing protein n=1 Tax=Cyclobacterium lianum TaxID=388280 RepID=A0A1M7M201_9BACT|nr:YceI family protein [Cyclobacterium lianum]SHM84668.1 YceI-like domain-containing protein [Cyclobacterium lianum]